MSKEYAHCLSIIIFLLKSNDDKTHLKHLPLRTQAPHEYLGMTLNPLFSKNQNMLELLLVTREELIHSLELYLYEPVTVSRQTILK